MKKLIIWDFDGVISDTESLWVTSRMLLLNRDFNLGWNFEKTFNTIGGRSDKDKKKILNDLGIDIKDDFMQEAYLRDMEIIKQGLTLTPYIEDIFKLTQFDQCIATGGIREKTNEKIKQTGISSYFPQDKVFTVDMVKNGKPQPDLFLLAAKTMGYTPDNCVVIEDSVVGIKAALNAHMTPIAFIKYNPQQFIDEIKNLNIDYIFDDMRDIKKLLEKL